MSSHNTRDSGSKATPITLPRLQEMRQRDIPIAMLTCYDSTFAELLDTAGVDCMLVGDSLGMVVQGKSTTIPVSLDEIVYHTKCVAQRKHIAWLLSDLPFGSYYGSAEQALASSVELMRAGAQMVKLEGGGWTAEVVHFLVERGIPVCAHLGLTPQSVHAIGGYRIQAKTEETALTLVNQARELADAGASMMVLELVPSGIAEKVQKAVPEVITIGIGAGPNTSGQVLVLHDMLGVTQGKSPRFVRNFMLGAESIESAITGYVKAVKERSFPDIDSHCY